MAEGSPSVPSMVETVEVESKVSSLLSVISEMFLIGMTASPPNPVCFTTACEELKDLEAIEGCCGPSVVVSSVAAVPSSET